jgi:pimeloyl-ACP methyl ester carboxylesterase
MRRKVMALFAALVLAVVAAGFQLPSAAGAPGGGDRPGHDRPDHPIVFVHGFAGSAAQFESQALRFMSNGYPAEWIGAVDYDSQFTTAPMEQVWEAIDAEVDRILAETGADQVDLAGHSLGTRVLQGYLTSSPERAARAAHYVNIDGFPAAEPPGGVSTLAVWGMGNEAGEIPGAENYHDDTQSHVQVATSAETFAAVYEFLTGEAPRTTDIVPQFPGRVTISGRATTFIQNAGAEGATLELWRVDRRTGHRVDDEPVASEVLPADGSFGPLRVNGFQTYELALVRDGSTHHFYASPFVRSSHLVRLLTSEPGTGVDLLRETSDRHSSLTLVRNKEVWGDQGEAGDSLTVAGNELATPEIAPQSKRAIGIFAFDAGVDGTTDLSAPLPTLFALPFITGGDVFLPATTPPDGTIRVETVQRGGTGEPEVINVPNWASSTDHISVNLRDWSQEDATFPWFPQHRHGRG